MDKSNVINRYVTKKSETIATILALSCFFTNLSQLSLLVDLGMSSLISTLIWPICLASILIVSRKAIIKKSALNIIWIALFFLIVVVLNYFISRNDYFQSAHVNALFITVFIYFTGSLSSIYFNDYFWKKVGVAYIISACIVGIDVFIKYFAVGYDISVVTYAYGSKNSLSQILLTSIILLAFGIDFDVKNNNLIKYSLIVGQFILICLMKARAAILGFGVIYLAFLSNKQIKKQYKWISLGIFGLLIIFIIRNQQVNKLIIQDILLVGDSSLNFNTISSGRIIRIKSAIDLFVNHLLLGIGNYYIDCYPIAVFVQFGLVAGCTLIIYAICPLLYLLNKKGNISNNVYISFLSITIVYLFNGIFEALSPIGPGVKCYYMWLIFGILKNRRL